MNFSQQLFERAQQVIPGGVNSPVRAFKAVGGYPRFIDRGQGPYLFDVDQKSYVDYISSWGALILGHVHPDVLMSVQQTIVKGMTYGAPTALEVELAEKIVSLIPSLDQIRMCSSGTEATMSAIRLARGYTGRDGILKFAGCYHGHSDALLAKAGSGLLTLGIPGCPGVPEAVVNSTYTLPYNDLNCLEDFFKSKGSELACVILEPVACNMNLVIPPRDYLLQLRNLCTQYGVLLIFDEVITGFRLGLTGAQGYYGIIPDLSTYGKIIGGGFPVGAYGGRLDIMRHVAPVGLIYQAGTLSGNPVAMSAGLATLNLISQAGFYEKLKSQTEKFVQGLQELAVRYQIPLRIKQLESIFGLFFTDQAHIDNFTAVSNCDIEQFKTFFHAMLDEGIYFGPSAYEAGFISAAHTDKELELTFQAAEKVFAAMANAK